MALLELRNVVKRFPGHTAVDGVSLSIPANCFFALIGPSGCGKTTLLRMIAGLEAPTSGEVLLRGERINEKRPYERNVSTVFQNYALFPHMTAERNVAFGLEHRKEHGIAEKVRDILALVRMESKLNRYPHQLSGGERQRVALARSLVLAPDILLLDEPLSALDPLLRRQVRGELKDLQRRVGITFLLVTHDQEEALSMADRIAVMNGGRLEQTGGPREVYATPATRFVAGFLGSVNWIGGVGIRPESLRLAGEHTPDGVRQQAATVTGSTYLGNCVQVHAALPGGEGVVAELPAHDPVPAPGDPVLLWWRREHELRFPGAG